MGDARSLSDDTLAPLRARAVAMVAAGATQAAAAQALGVHKNTVSRWLQAWRAAGDAALEAKPRGRRPGEQKRLSAAQEAAIQRLIRDRCPDQLKPPFALWTRAAVRALIATRLGIALALTTVGDYLRCWGFTPQRPAKRALERQDAKIRAWLARQYPAIAARAKAEGAEIHWGDETAIANQASYRRSFAPQGQTPVVARTAKRPTISMISTVTNRGTTRFMLYDGALDVTLFLTFLRRLTRDAARKIFLIVDNLKVHHAKKVKTWVADHHHAIELCFLPPYAPRTIPTRSSTAPSSAASPSGRRRTTATS